MTKLTLLFKENYLALIKNSVGTKMFRNCFFLIDDQLKVGQSPARGRGRKIDVLNNGDLACAYFVSGILKMLDLIGDLHTTVKSTISDIKRSGWRETKVLKEGAILVWEKKKYDDGWHSHIGFYIGNQKAISNHSSDGRNKTPKIHHFTYNNKRKIEKIFWHNKLG